MVNSPIRHSMVQSHAFAESLRIGIDLGGTKIESVLLSPDGRTLHRHRRPTPRQADPVAEYAAICDAVCAAVSDLLVQVPEPDACTVGVGIPGTIQPDTGLVQNANTTCLSGRPFQRDLEQRLGRAVGMENDANCFTLAEARMGAGKGFGLVFGVIMGTGCGGGICINGDLHVGSHRIAGEWGHFSVDPNGHTCFCGNVGCIETKISGGGVATAFHLKYGQRLSMEQIVQGHRQGDDPRCTAAFEQFIDDFGRCLGGLISVLDPDAVILGGGLSNIDELYSMGVVRLQHYAFHEKVGTPVLKNHMGDSAGVFGAASVGRRRS